MLLGLVGKQQNGKIYKESQTNNISNLRIVSMIPSDRKVAGCFIFSNFRGYVKVPNQNLYKCKVYSNINMLPGNPKGLPDESFVLVNLIGGFYE